MTKDFIRLWLRLGLTALFLSGLCFLVALLGQPSWEAHLALSGSVFFWLAIFLLISGELLWKLSKNRP